MIARLMCKACGAELSGSVRIYSTKDPSTPGPVMEDQKPITPPGHALQVWEPMQSSADPNTQVPLEFVPQFWMNPSDTDGSVEVVKDARRLNGCCGLSGCDGPNMCCKQCGAEVGTRQSDCWTADVFIPEPQATDWIREEK